MVHRRHAEPGRQLRRPWAASEPDATARRVGGRGRPPCARWTYAELQRPGRRPGRAPRADAGVGPGDARRHLPADDPRGGRGAAGGGQARRGLPAALLRLRRRPRSRSGSRTPAPRRWSPPTAPTVEARSCRWRSWLDKPCRASVGAHDGDRAAARTAGRAVPRAGGALAACRGPALRDALVDSEHPLFIAYTSGTTGRPKGSVHVHGGWLAKVAEEGAFQFDCGRDDRSSGSPTSVGSWVPWEITAALANGATVALYEGAPDHPRPDRLWAYVERHRVTDPRHQPDARPRAHGPRRRAGRSARPVVALRILGVDGRALERGSVALVLRRSSAVDAVP